jgi:hypothetical protein
MLSIDRKQYDFLQEALRGAFKQKLVAHVRTHFPRHAAQAGEQGMAGFVELALIRAQRRGYAAEREIALWLNMMLQLGVTFDEDPLLPWRGKLPEISPGDDSFAALNDLYGTAEGYLEKIAGPNGDRLAAAIGRFVQASAQDIVVQPSQSTEQMVNAMAKLYPEKYQSADYPALQVFMQATIARCLKAGINVKDRIVLLMLFDFILGMDADVNPLFIPALTRNGEDTLAEVPLGELLQRMQTLMQGLIAPQSGGR